MNPPPPKSPPQAAPSAPFADRELNGTGLLEEMRHLREAVVNQKHINDCAIALRGLPGKALLDAMLEIKSMATTRFQTQPELARLLVTWAARVKGPRDFIELCLHFQRLAMASSLLAAMYRGAGRLPNPVKKK